MLHSVALGNMDITQHIELLPGEQWKPVVGRDGYEISNHGRIFSWKSRFKYNYRPVGLLKPHSQSLGYKTTSMGYKPVFIHRLVGLHFIDNPDNKPEINHIDGNKANNHHSNLEWVTRSENIKKSFETGQRIAPTGSNHHNYGKSPKFATRRKMSVAKLGVKHPKFKGHYSINGTLYESANQAGKILNIPSITVIRRCNSPKFPEWVFVPKQNILTDLIL